MKRSGKSLFTLFMILLLAGGVFAMRSVIGGSKYGNDVLERCSTSTGGGMTGGSRSATLKRDGDGGAVLEVREREWHGAREFTTVYRVDPAAFDRIAEMVNEYDLYAASRRPRSNVVVLDGDTTSVSFDYSKGDFYVYDGLSLTRKMSEGFDRVVAYLYSLAEGEGTVTVEPQIARLYLKNGYTLRFTVENVFDGRLEEALGEECGTSRFGDFGIAVGRGEVLDVSGAQPTGEVSAGDIVYDPESGRIVLLYADPAFPGPVYLLARIDGHVSSAAPLIREMEGAYAFVLN